MFAMKVERVLRLPDVDQGPTHNIIRLNNRRIDSFQVGTEGSFFRRDPVLIKNEKNGHSIIRYAMGNPGTISKLNKNTIALDYDAVVALGIPFKTKDIKLVVRKAKRFEIYKWYWEHHNLEVRLSFRMGAIGTVFGFSGIAAGLVTSGWPKIREFILGIFG